MDLKLKIVDVAYGILGTDSYAYLDVQCGDGAAGRDRDALTDVEDPLMISFMASPGPWSSQARQSMASHPMASWSRAWPSGPFTVTAPMSTAGVDQE